MNFLNARLSDHLIGETLLAFQIQRSALVNFSAQQMFDLVNDIESYPQFMEGCSAAKILKREGNTVEAELTLTKAGISQKFCTRNALQSPHKMSMQLLEGPFKYLTGEWNFQVLSDSACKVNFELHFELQNPLVGFAMGKLMESVANQQVDSICKRAQVIYKK